MKIEINKFIPAVKKTINQNTLQFQYYQINKNFMKLFQELTNEKPYLVQYLKDLDAYDSATYNHSIRVALQTYNLMLKDPTYTKAEIKEWISAALVHDAGKLEIPIEILNSRTNYSENPIKAHDESKIMLDHSFKGQSVGEKYGFNRSEMLAVMCHHLGTEALENNFNDSNVVKDIWKELYPNHEMDKILRKEFCALTPNEIKNIKRLSFCDVCEALRSSDRKYKSSRDWEDKQIVENNMVTGTLLGICSIVQINAKKHELSNLYVNLVNDKDFQNDFDALQKNIPTTTRLFLNKISKELSFQLSNYKIDEIKENPKLGYQFQLSGDSKNYHFDLGNHQILVVPREKELHDFSNYLDKAMKSYDNTYEPIVNNLERD